MSSIGSKTILVVDDDSAIRELTAKMLERQGYGVIEADSGSQGLERFNQHRSQVNLILSDVVMPQMSGTEMVEQIHAVDPSMLVLFMTGYAADSRLPEYVPVLPKPFNAEMLEQTVRRCLAV